MNDLFEKAYGEVRYEMVTANTSFHQGQAFARGLHSFGRRTLNVSGLVSPYKLSRLFGSKADVGEDREAQARILCVEAFNAVNDKEEINEQFIDGFVAELVAPLWMVEPMIHTSVYTGEKFLWVFRKTKPKYPRNIDLAQALGVSESLIGRQVRRLLMCC